MNQVKHKLIEVVTSAGKSLTVFENGEITRQIQQKGEYDRWALASLRDAPGRLRPRTCLDVGTKSPLQNP